MAGLKSDQRNERRAAELRENLAKRKTLSRKRREAEEPRSETDPKLTTPASPKT